MVFMPNITYKSCCYLFILWSEKFLQRPSFFIFPANLCQTTCFQPSLYTNLATSTCIFVQVWLSSKIFGIWNSRNLSAIFFNSASKGQVAMETVIFTCRYFKLSRNTTGLGQSDCRNFHDTHENSNKSLEVLNCSQWRTSSQWKFLHVYNYYRKSYDFSCKL